jgi:hypothetical protein
MGSGPLRGSLLVLVLLAGCGGLLPGAPESGGTGDGEVRYGLAVENGAPGERTFTLRVLDGDREVLNRSKRLAAGERWHVTNLSSERFDGEYAVVVRVDGDRTFETSGSFREEPGVNRVSGGSLIVLGGSAGTHHICAGNVTCYEAAVD